MAKPKVLSIMAGSSHNGKTTLLCNILPYLTPKLKVGVIKHTHHALEFNGKKDSDLILQSDIAKFSIVSPTSTMTLEQKAEPTLESLLLDYQDMDLVILEGYKDADLPKIEILRDGFASSVYTKSENLLFIVTDIVDFQHADVAIFHPSDFEKIAIEILNWYEKNK